jgi:hypothetical protein
MADRKMKNTILLFNIFLSVTETTLIVAFQSRIRLQTEKIQDIYC